VVVRHTQKISDAWLFGAPHNTFLHVRVFLVVEYALSFCVGYMILVNKKYRKIIYTAMWVLDLNTTIWSYFLGILIGGGEFNKDNTNLFLIEI
jgi:hypothetical protein